MDNLLQVGHTIAIEAHTVISAQAGIEGSAKIGQSYQIGGQAGFMGYIQAVIQLLAIEIT